MNGEVKLVSVRALLHFHIILKYSAATIIWELYYWDAVDRKI